MDIIVAMPNDLDLAQNLGIKGTSNGITFFNHTGASNIVFLVPSIIESYNTLPQVIMLSNIVVINTKNVDPLLGEILIACELIKKPIILTDDTDINYLTAGLSTQISIVPKDKLLEKLYAFASNLKISREDPEIVLDRSFNIKGIGDVALGIIKKGSVKTYDKLIHSSGKEVTIKHIQSHDIDINEATAGTRVGLAIKGIESKEIEKGDLLSKKEIKRVKSGVIELLVSSVIKDQKLEGNFLAAGDFVASEISIKNIDGKLNFKLAKGLPLEIGSKLFILRKEAPKIFALGTIIDID
ncbi:MAG: hypothetical protein QXS81_02835 [Candidatus Micrarchaeaceae archaeon]